MFELRCEASFDSAHFLTDYHGKCENLHGHRWRVVACLGAEELGYEGTQRDMVMDFAAFKRELRSVVSDLDHTFLVEEGSLRQETIAALEAEGFVLKVLPFRTTAENLARHISDQLMDRGLACSRVEVFETPGNCAVFVPSEQ